MKIKVIKKDKEQEVVCPVIQVVHATDANIQTTISKNVNNWIEESRETRKLEKRFSNGKIEGWKNL